MTCAPYSLLFLSCDLVGSTQYKQREAQWQETFLSFYRQFPQSLTELPGGREDLEFELWKPVGDELIFKVPVLHERDVYDAVLFWLEAMNAYEAGPLEKTGLQLKGGAFIATFPGPDSEATVPRMPGVETSDADVVSLNRQALEGERDHERYLFDYFGPSIDTGFRILAACGRRHFTLSIEVTWAMQRYAQDAPKALEQLVWLDGRQLKGVWEERSYPLFALDREHDDAVHDALRELHHTRVDLSKVADVCRACLDSDHWPSGVYLPKSDFGRFKEIPADSLDTTPEATGALDMSGVEEPAPADEAGAEQLTDTPPMGPRIPDEFRPGLMSIKVGTIVEHATWGPGRVIETRGAQEKRQARIDFEGVGVKWLMLMFAPLRVVQEPPS